MIYILCVKSVTVIGMLVMLAAALAAAREPVSYGYSLGGGAGGYAAPAPIRREAAATAYIAPGPIITPINTGKEEEYRDYSVSCFGKFFPQNFQNFLVLS